jgi:hypothetical protein
VTARDTRGGRGGGDVSSAVGQRLLEVRALELLEHAPSSWFPQHRVEDYVSVYQAQ